MKNVEQKHQELLEALRRPDQVDRILVNRVEIVKAEEHLQEVVDWLANHIAATNTDSRKNDELVQRATNYATDAVIRLTVLEARQQEKLYRRARTIWTSKKDGQRESLEQRRLEVIKARENEACPTIWAREKEREIDRRERLAQAEINRLYRLEATTENYAKINGEIDSAYNARDRIHNESSAWQRIYNCLSARQKGDKFKEAVRERQTEFEDDFPFLGDNSRFESLAQSTFSSRQPTRMVA